MSYEYQYNECLLLCVVNTWLVVGVFARYMSEYLQTYTNRESSYNLQQLFNVRIHNIEEVCEMYRYGGVYVSVTH